MPLSVWQRRLLVIANRLCANRLELLGVLGTVEQACVAEQSAGALPCLREIPLGAREGLRVFVRDWLRLGQARLLIGRQCVCQRVGGNKYVRVASRVGDAADLRAHRHRAFLCLELFVVEHVAGLCGVRISQHSSWMPVVILVAVAWALLRASAAVGLLDELRLGEPLAKRVPKAVDERGYVGAIDGLEQIVELQLIRRPPRQAVLPILLGPLL